MAASALTQLVTDSDQPARRSELIAFLGPNPAGFLAYYDRTVANVAAGDRRLTSIASYGLCAPAFFLGPVWFFYRKMWLWASGYCLIMVLLATVPIGGQASLGLSVAAALVARWAYLDHAARIIGKIRLTRSLDEEAYFTQLAAAGGVSRWAGWLSGAFFATALALAVYQAFH